MNELKKYLTESEIIELQQIKSEYDKADFLVKILFKDKKDALNEPYYNHLKRVSDRLENQNTKIAGLLHDTIEDIDYITIDTLKEIGFNDETLELVKLVTNDKEMKTQEDYHNKITKILNSNNIEAVKLKHSDMSDNYNFERLSKLSEEKRKHFIEKYQNEYKRLEEYLKGK